ncbi:MAG TPA: NAD(P)H-dependent oxidoreductase subunit E [Acidobacteriaceae bacterium]|nr:NAD(P)H-dependent oxidoreductase subunit E [Acidobacteriaceae bacterium]
MARDLVQIVSSHTQPPSEDAEVARSIAEIALENRNAPHRLLDIVLKIQDRYGFISDEAILAVARVLGMRSVEVEDMVSFYSFLNRRPKGRCGIRLSRTPISLMKGALEVAEAFVKATGVSFGGDSPDGKFTLEWCSDIGVADQEPAALINGAVYTRLTPGRVPVILAALQKGPPFATSSDSKQDTRPEAEVKSNILQRGPVLLRQDAIVGEGIRAALRLTPDAVIQEIEKARLRGRGGAGFLTALKWKFCREAIGEQRYVVCNADEGEPGTFKDRVLLTEYSDLVFDGMTVAAYALGAGQGLLYLRGEYTYLWRPLQDVLKHRRERGLLGADICGRAGFDFDIRIQLGAGAYVCGEETALLESAEGKRGVPRERPPFPTERGYLGQPTVVNNVETLACAARIMEYGAGWFAGHGTPESTGTKLLSISGDCTHPGVYEVPMGISIREILEMVSVHDAQFVQVGGPSGQALAAKDYGRRIAFGDLPTCGTVMIFGPDRDVIETALQFTEFFVDESCGWCVPCRVGTTLLKKELEKILANRATPKDIVALDALANTVMRMSRCGLGQTAANPILTTMQNFPHVYQARVQKENLIDLLRLQGQQHMPGKAKP